MNKIFKVTPSKTDLLNLKSLLHCFQDIVDICNKDYPDDVIDRQGIQSLRYIEICDIINTYECDIKEKR